MGIKLWTTGIVFACILSYLFIADGLSLDDINSAIEGVFGVKTVSLDELKQMADDGRIPYEVYRLAVYKKLEDPQTIFKVDSLDWKLSIYKLLHLHTSELLPKVYIFQEGWGRVLEGRYVEKVNDSWLRVVIVDYDDLFANKYYSVKVDVPAGLRSGYVVDSWWPSYLKVINKTDGRWSYTKWKKISGETSVLHILDPNPEDTRISRAIASQVLEYGKENNLTRTQIIQLVYDSLVRDAILYVSDNSWFEKPFIVNVLDGDYLIPMNITRSDSLMKSLLLFGKGSCYAQTAFVIFVLNQIGVGAGMFVTCDGNYEYGWHAEVAIPVRHLNLEELHIRPGAEGVPIRPVIVDVNGTKEKFVVYTIEGPDYRVGEVNTSIKGWFANYIFK